MQFKFDANQEYQVRAIESVALLLEGQPRNEADLSFSLGGFAAVPNQLDLDEAALIANLQVVQRENGLPADDVLQLIEESIETVEGRKQVRFGNFSVEMETGTGKTYVYLRTALELYRRYGLRKFIAVVPSVAVREGVLKALKVTEKHLRELYGNTPYRYYVYDSANLSQVRQFALSDGVEIMVMTIDSFNRASNVIRQSTDRLQGETPIHLVQAARPVLILDEPQNMESELRVRALAALDPLFALRYSATHRNPYNVVYRLSPFEAYRQGLVKRIEVGSVVQSDDENLPFLRLDQIRAEKRTLTARIALHKLMKNGTVKEQVVTVRPGGRLEENAGRPEYAPFVVDEIDAAAGVVTFANGDELRLGETKGADKDAIFAAQIRYTVEAHMRRQARLRGAGIKVLSLFFIDRVDNYVRDDGIIRRLFKEAFDDLKVQHPHFRDADAAAVQAAYFAQRRTRAGQVVYEDSKTGEAERDREAYELIMQEKERLLSFDEPTAFIFSHSALREGWDNPNVFQICTLNQTVSEMKKRQEVGRGVRLAVNQNGDRVHDEQINVLTVVANESYERYVERLQSEIEAEYGTEGLPPKPANARKRRTARLRKQYTLRPEFKELWEKIRQKTRYAVRIDSERLITEVVAELDSITITPPRITITKAQVEVVSEGGFVARQATATRTAMELRGRYVWPNLVGLMEHLLLHTTPPVRLTRRTLLEIFRRSAQKQAALDNPHGFATEAVRIIKEKLTDQLVAGIQYDKIDEWYEMCQFEGEIESWEQYLVPARRSVYDHVIFDSETEREFVQGLERRDDVRLYLKLPSWFTVPTPVGDYNPDWAIVMEDRDEHGEARGRPLMYLVRETKDTTDRGKLRPDERRKIACGEKHFDGALGVNYKVVTSAGDLP
jgi:type III restriction enzyme